MAVTGEEAAAAIKEGEGLAHQLAAAQKLQGQQLETEVAALKQVSVIQLWLKDATFCSTPVSDSVILHRLQSRSWPQMQ